MKDDRFLELRQKLEELVPLDHETSFIYLYLGILGLYETTDMPESQMNEAFEEAKKSARVEIRHRKRMSGN